MKFISSSRCLQHIYLSKKNNLNVLTLEGKFVRDFSFCNFDSAANRFCFSKNRFCITCAGDGRANAGRKNFFNCKKNNFHINTATYFPNIEYYYVNK